MKSITIDISEQVYGSFKELLNKLPKGSFSILEEDSDFLTAEETEVLYSVQNKLKNGDFSDFEDWNNVKDNI
jgi:hypothetical protein